MARILQAYEPPDGGVAEHVRALCLSLYERGHEVVVAGPLESQIYPDLEGAGIPFERLDLVGTIIDRRRDPSAWWAMRRLLAEGDFDAAHAHGAKAATLLRTAGPTVHVPVLYTPHLFALISNEHRDDIPHPRLRRAAVLSAERGLGLLTARLVCVSAFERRFADRWHIVPAARRRTIPNGVSLDRAAEPDPELFRWRGEGPLFGAVSMLRWEKGLRHLVEVAVILNERGSDVKLAIVGDGPERAELKRRIERAGVGERIRLFPFSGSSDPHLSALDGLVLPSDVFESLPIGVIEAMAHSLPVIASNIGGLPELVKPGTTGILVPPADPISLAEAIEELAANPNRAAEMGSAGRLLAESEFSLEAMTDALEREYRAVSGSI